MRSSFTATTGLKLVPSPSARDRATRRRWVVLAAIGALALAGGGFGLLTAPTHSSVPDARTGPFSYFPSE